MMAPGHLDAVRAIVRDGGYAKVTPDPRGRRHPQRDHAAGARTRSATRTARCCFHDAVRPLVSPRIITECFEALDDYDAVDVAIPSADTIIEVGDDNTIREIPPRADLRRGQTPQAFRASVIRAAYAEAGAGPRLRRHRRLHASCCATSPTCRSGWSPATSAT